MKRVQVLTVTSLSKFVYVCAEEHLRNSPRVPCKALQWYIPSAPTPGCLSHTTSPATGTGPVRQLVVSQGHLLSPSTHGYLLAIGPTQVWGMGYGVLSMGFQRVDIVEQN